MPIGLIKVPKSISKLMLIFRDLGGNYHNKNTFHGHDQWYIKHSTH
jgi:hypothetical protein